MTQEEKAFNDRPKLVPPGERPCPFEVATPGVKRLKLFIFGMYGVGKTPLALQFPAPIAIDLEGGMDHYKHMFYQPHSQNYLKTASADKVMEAVEWLLTHKHGYRTLIIDPITIYWEAVQKKWSDIFMLRNKKGTGYKHEFYEFQTRDWNTAKSEVKDLMRKLMLLDMNVIVTAREKTKYKDGAFMVSVGETFDAEKNLPYYFDTIVRMYKNNEGKVMGHCERDRTKRLPADKDFPCTYDMFKELIGEDNLNKEARPVDFITHDQRKKIEHYFQVFNLSPDLIKTRLLDYDAENLDDLTSTNAGLIIDKLEASLGALSK